MKKKRNTLGQKISTLVYFFSIDLVIFESIQFFIADEFLKAILVFTGAFLSFMATFRYRIKDYFIEARGK